MHRTHIKAMFRSPLTALLMTMLVMAGCAAPPTTKGMTARLQAAPQPLADHTLSVDPVQGARPDPLQRPSLGAEPFRRALVDSLVRSGYFRGVTTSGLAGWRLRATILSQETRGMRTNIEEILVRYEITDPRRQEKILTETVFASDQMSTSDIFAGNTRVRVLIERTARKNIEEFLRRLQRRLADRPGSR